MATCDNLTKQTEQELKEIQETSTRDTSSEKNTIEHLEATYEFIREEELDEFKEALSTQDLPTAIQTIKSFIDQQDHVELNIAVTGESGSGKSTFVNAFRGLGDEDEGSAKTGPVETTMETEVYVHPKYKNVKVWDLPGIGTPNFKADKYLQQVQFQRYDFFIIIASDRFREYHTQLAKEIMRMEKTFYFVRSKIDSNIYAEQRKKSFDLQKTLNIIRKDCEKELTNIGAAAPAVFLISCIELSKYDFNLLQEKMEQDLSKHKRHVLMLAIPNITLEINEKKKKALEKNISSVAFLSACVAAIPVPGLSFAVDLVIVRKEIEKYYSAFGLDDQSLQVLCEKTIEELRNVMTSPLHLGISPTTIISLLGAASLYASETAIEYACSLIPVLGTVVAGTMSYLTVSGMLKKALYELADDARKVLLAALETEV